mgnify:CR=1 FL=1
MTNRPDAGDGPVLGGILLHIYGDGALDENGRIGSITPPHVEGIAKEDSRQVCGHAQRAGALPRADALGIYHSGLHPIFIQRALLGRGRPMNILSEAGGSYLSPMLVLEGNKFVNWYNNSQNRDANQEYQTW